MQLAKTLKAPSDAVCGYYPNGINITIDHPQYGHITMSFEDNEGDATKINHWHTKSVSMWVFTIADTNKAIKHIANNSKIVSFDTNSKKWEKYFTASAK